MNLRTRIFYFVTIKNDTNYFAHAYTASSKFDAILDFKINVTRDACTILL